MGCASSKKRTTSIEDLQAGGNAVNKEPLLNKNKNGQLPSTDNNAPIMRETAKQTQGAPPPSSSDAIHIPGAHKSFLAPDGIPFIDEDVDDDEERNGGSGDAPAVGKPDVNKNVVKEPLANHQPQPAPPAPTSVPPPVVVEEVKPPTVIVAGEQRTVVAVAPSAATSSEDATYRAALDVFSKDLDFEPVSAQNETHTSISVTTLETTVVTTSAENQESQPPVTDEQQLAAAAVKIQAGIRGYRDRQKVKAIRAAQQSPTDGPASAVQQDDVNVSIVVADGDENYAAESTELYDEDADAREETEEQPVLAKDQESEDDASDRVKSEDLDEPEKERAAVKIQANYKGWKTRKEVGKVKK